MGHKYFYGYNIVAASSIIQVIYLGGLFSFGVLFPEFEREFEWSRATISGAASLFFLTFGVFGIIMGSATDRFGPKLVLTASGTIFSLGFILMHRMTSVFELYFFYGFLAGLGFAAHDVSTLSTVTRWFVHKRGLMSGIVKCGSGLGQAIIPIITAYFVIEFGWRTSCLLIGGFSLIIILAAQFLHRDPSKLSLQPLGEGFMGDTATPRIENNLSLRDALRKKYFLILALTKLLDMFCLLTIITHIVPYGTDHGLTSAQSVLILSAIGGFSIIGRILFGSLFDKFGTKLSLMTCFSVLLLSFITIQATEGLYFMLVFSFIYGVAHGGFFAIASPSVADFFGTKAHGIIFGIILFFGTLGGTAGPILAGSIFDNKGSYDIVFFILTMTALIGIGLAASLPNPINDKTNFVNTNE